LLSLWLLPHTHTRLLDSCAAHRLLANLYNGNVYLWNYNDSVRAREERGARAVSPAAARVRASVVRREQWRWMLLLLLLLLLQEADDEDEELR
jgi:hypothetical protein